MRKQGLLKTRSNKINVRVGNSTDNSISHVLNANTTYFAEWDYDEDALPWVYFTVLSIGGEGEYGWVHTDYVDLIYVQDISDDIPEKQTDTEQYVELPLAPYPTIRLTEENAKIVSLILRKLANIIDESGEYNDDIDELGEYENANYDGLSLSEVYKVLALAFELGSLKTVYNESVSD